MCGWWFMKLERMRLYVDKCLVLDHSKTTMEGSHTFSLVEERQIGEDEDQTKNEAGKTWLCDRYERKDSSCRCFFQADIKELARTNGV